jgi:outer membrane cobalamin receptor
MGDYVTVDWRSRVAVAPGVFMTLSIDNVMDRHYREFPTFDQPGRSFLVGAELKF